MKLYERIGARQNGQPYHTTLLTTFSIDFTALESVILPQIQNAGCANVLVLCDSRMATQALEEGGVLPRGAGRQYVLAQPTQASGVFHPKILLQVGKGGAKAIVSSANATSAGLAGNVEIATEITCGVEPSAAQSFVGAVLAYLERKTPSKASAARDALAWMRQRTPWLANLSADGTNVWNLPDGSRLGFFSDPLPGQISILERFLAEIGDRAVDRVLVVSPYWDDQLQALKVISERLRPSDLVVLLQAATGLFPGQAAQALDVRLIEAPASFGTRFLHAKLIVAFCGEEAHLLAGSANCTAAALGNEGFTGANSEAVVYRKLPASDLVKSLDLESVLSNKTLDAADIPPVRQLPNIPLDDLRSMDGGHFEAGRGRLEWRPSPNFDPNESRVQVLGGNLEEIGVIPVGGWSPGSDGTLITMALEGISRASFARAVSSKGRSSLCVVDQLDVLRAQRREPGSAAVERMKVMLADAAELEIEQIEWLSKLEEADLKERALSPRIDVGHKTKDVASTTFQKLSYEQFTKGRTVAPHLGSGRDTLVGYHSAAIQALLERVVGRQDAIADGEDIVADEGVDPDDYTPRAGAEGVFQARAARAVFQVSAFEQAVKHYEIGLATRVAKGQIGSIDVLRLRFLITLIMSYALPPSSGVRLANGLVCGTRDEDWPRLVFRVLKAFFYGPAAAIVALALEEPEEQMPDDYLAAWATALWAAAETHRSYSMVKPGADFLKYVDQLTKVIRARTGISPSEENSDAFVAVRAGLANRFATAPERLARQAMIVNAP